MSFYSVNTDNINLESINWVPIADYIDNVNPSHGVFGTVNVSNGAKQWTGTNYTFDTVAGSKYQVLASTGAPTPCPIHYNDQLRSVYLNSTLLSDSTNATVNVNYIISNFNASAVLPASTNEPIPTFQLVDGKDYTLTVTVTGTPAAISAGSIQVGIATSTYINGGGGTITYTLSPVAASYVTINSGSFSSPGGYSASATITSGANSLLAMPYIFLSSDFVWTLSSLINISVSITQNN
jgi:hypothetical protein